MTERRKSCRTHPVHPVILSVFFGKEFLTGITTLPWVGGGMPQHIWPCLRFLCVESELWFRLLSSSVSPRTLCPSPRGSGPPLGPSQPQRTFTLKLKNMSGKQKATESGDGNRRFCIVGIRCSDGLASRPGSQNRRLLGAVSGCRKSQRGNQSWVQITDVYLETPVEDLVSMSGVKARVVPRITTNHPDLSNTYSLFCRRP